MKNKTLFIGLRRLMAVVLLMLTVGCESFVAVDLPSSQLSLATVFEEPATANAAMTDIYAKMRDNGLLTGYGYGMHAALGLYADELDYYGGGTAFFYTNTLLPNNGDVSLWWSSSYNQIYAANAVYEGVSASAKLSQPIKDQLMGEALFVRGMLHFYLVNLYGDVPYITTTDYGQNQKVHRMSVAEVYTRIIADLEMAQTLLPTSYVGGNRVRPNRFVATALLARVYLYHGDYAAASNAASAVLNEAGTYTLDSDLDTAFLKDSPGTLWQFSPPAEGRNTEEGSTYIFVAGPPPFAALRNELINAFETGDLRKTHWVKAVTDGSSTWYHAYKYKEPTATGTSMEYSIVLRLSEQYLIRAEARAKQGFLTGAKEDLDVIRNLAGLLNTTAVTQQEILSAIVQERRVEFFTEGGHRFFDLKRAQQLDAVLSPIKPGWSSTDALLPLPESELLLNPNLLPQNPGY
ncbi:RagB/SusD family nutrient uptake outer membrane protein [Flavobacterium silvisoli]|uniref:RagB/SusD family nutrient uptake outer membrane protein n=1 Tax=Flavobacterium silvisoli TaxID=2529433 RepID=A0A4V2L4W2_9FLAO|nr:RagB/SusD family nutrient uptake outer membrane protein [Flavobacterium silvisoli]TBX68353.1 RagB/SusD family nutrient uptake outer membrane protein [Flavobacterium silvisoli]